MRCKVQEEAIDPSRYVGMAVRWWWVLLLGPIVGGLLAYSLAYSQFANQESIYEARATILVQQTQSSFLPNLTDMQTSQRLAATYRRLITTRPVLEEVAQEVADQMAITYTPEEIRGLFQADVVSGTQLMEITAQHTNPEAAQLIAQTVAEVFIDQTQQSRLFEIARLQAAAEAQGLANPSLLLDAQLSALGSLTIVDPAIIPRFPLAIENRTASYIAAGVALGTLLAILVIFALEYLGDKIRSVDEVERIFKLTNLGVVLRWNPKKVSPDQVLLTAQPRSGYAEMFRQIRANFLFAIAARPGKIFMITSSEPSEGKTTVLANLGVALAMGGRKVVLIDSDLRRPALHKYFGISNQKGLSTLLSDPGASHSSVVQEISLGETSIAIIPSGPIPPNPAELLDSKNMRDSLEQLKEHYELVLLDSPPMGAVADAKVIASQTDGVILLAVLGQTKTAALKESIKGINSAGAAIRGIVLNKVRLPTVRYPYRYSNYYYYRSRYGEEEDAQSTSNGGSGESRDGWTLAAPWHSLKKLVSRK